MGDKGKQVNWERDVSKGLDEAKNIKDKMRDLDKAADNRKIDGFNPGDTSSDKK